tara:strand:+ start:176 stop:298 length:123 start_codon:yes stop_codon:yes gene_type:complete
MIRKLALKKLTIYDHMKVRHTQLGKGIRRERRNEYEANNK